MLVGLWAAYASFGLVSGGIPPLIGIVSRDLDLSRSAMGTVLSAWPLIYIAVAIPAGVLIDKFGLKRCLLFGILLVSLSGLLRALAFNYATLFLAVAVFGLGGPFISIGAPKMIAEWFGKKERGMAMGIYMTASPVGRIIALATANSLLMPMFGASWRMTLVTYAVVSLVAGLLWLFIAQDVAPVVPEESRKDKTPVSGIKVFPMLLRIRVVQIVLIMSVGLFMINHGLNNWLPEILREGGMSPGTAGLWSTIPVAVGIVALLVIPQLATPARRMPMLFGVFVLAGLSVLVIGTAGGWPLFGGLVLQGAAGRGALPLLMITLMESRQVGSHRIGAAAGLYFTCGEVGGVLGPLLLGIVADLTGGFLGGMIFLAGLCAVLASLTVVLGHAIREQQTSTPYP